MTTVVDVAVVGGRIAGSTTAIELRRAGRSVCLVEQADPLGDTLSSHTVQGDVIEYLDSLGIWGQLVERGALATHGIDARLGALTFQAPWPASRRLGGTANLHRDVLDPLLLTAAAANGVDVRNGWRASALLRDDAGRVTGMRINRGKQVDEIEARVVVGADGRRSHVARIVDARTYRRARSGRAYCWAFYDDADHDGRFVFHRWDDHFIVAGPSDGSTYFVGVSASPVHRAAFRGDLVGAFEREARICAPVAATLAGARRGSRVHACGSLEAYFRTPAGPGWALVGDAGHFKDPAGGRGMGDAILQAVELARRVAPALDSDALDVDKELLRWGLWRDTAFRSEHWLANSLARAGPPSGLEEAVVRRMIGHGGMDTFMGLLDHTASPNRLLTPRWAVGGFLDAVKRGARVSTLAAEATTMMSAQIVQSMDLSRRRASASVALTRLSSDRRLKARGLGLSAL